MASLHMTVGIATAGRRAQLRRTLTQLREQTRSPDRIIVCPASEEDYDGASWSGAAPLDVLRGPRGLCAQRNAILRACGSSDVLVFLDDDFYPASDYLAQVVTLFTNRPDVVLATNRPALDGAPGPGIAHEQAVAALAELAASACEDCELRPTYGGYGCNMALRLAPIRVHGLTFDENLPLYGWLEDIDFSRRLAPYGQIVNAKQLRGVHLGTKIGRTSGARLGYSQIANPVYMLQKGSLSLRYALTQMGRNLARNASGILIPETWIDRRGRLRGNVRALFDLFGGQLHPRRALELD